MSTSKIFLATTLLALAGCEQSAAPSTDWSGSIEALTTRVSTLEEQVRDLRFRQFSATLKPNTPGYSTLATDEAVFPVQLLDVKPSGNGSKAVIRVGNPMNATVTKLSVLLSWGKTNEKGEPVDEVEHEGRYTFDGQFSPGAWTSKEIPIPDLPPSKLGFVRLSGALVESLSLPVE